MAAKGCRIPHFSIDQVRDLKNVFRFLNQKDRDILLLVFVIEKKQKCVQRILGRSQPSLCYDVRRIRARVQFIDYLNSVSDDFLAFVERADRWFDTQSIEVMTMLFYTTSFTHSSEVLGLPQIRVRYVFDRCLRTLEEMRMWDIFEIMDNIRSNLNIVKRVYRPHSGAEDAFLPA